MYSRLFYLIFLISFALNGEIMKFNFDDFQINLEEGIVTDKGEENESFVYYNNLKLPLLHHIYHDDDVYPQQIKIIDIKKRLISDIPETFAEEKSLEKERVVYDNIPLKMGGSGVMRHKGIYSLSTVPFLIENNKLYFVESIQYTLSDFKSVANPKYTIDEEIDLVVVTTDDMLDLFLDYKTFKLKQGIRTEIKTVESIEKEYGGINSADRIRNYLKDIYTCKNVKYVLLGGGYSLLPVVKIYAKRGQEPVASDLYYSNLDGDFDSNGNGIYGEVDDNVDYYPDLYIGRFPGNGREEMNAIIEKTMAYYKGELETCEDYYNSQLLVAFNLSKPGDTEGYCNNVINQLPSNYLVKQLSESSTSRFNLKTILFHLNKGYNLMYHNSHGNLDKVGQNGGWGIFSDHIFNTAAVSGLYFISSCHPGDFSVPVYSHKAMISPSGGCINYVGSSSNEWPSMSRNMTKFFFRRFLAGEPLGEALMESKISGYGGLSSPVAISRFLYFSYNLMGDPSNFLIVDKPLEIELAEVSAVTTGSGIVEAGFNSVLSEKITVSLIADDVIISQIHTDQQSFSLNYKNLSADSVTLAFSSPYSLLSSVSLPTVENDKFQIEINNFELDDQTDNGVIENGENFSISFDIKTINNTTVDSLLIIASMENEAGVGDDSVKIRLPEEGSINSFNPFQLNSSKETMFQDTVLNLNLSFETIPGNLDSSAVIFNRTLNLPFSCPDLVLGWVNFDKNNSTIKPVLINRKKGEIKKAEVKLYSNGKGENGITLHNIPGNCIVRDSLEFTGNDYQIFRLGIRINEGSTYFSKPFGPLGNTETIPLNFQIFPENDYIHLEWELADVDKYRFNVYLCYDDTLSTPQIINPYPLNENKFIFKDLYNGSKFIKIAVVDKYNHEFQTSSYRKVETIEQYANSPYTISPYQLYNPIFLNEQIISNSQNTSVAGLSFAGTPLGDNGLIYSAVSAGFNSISVHQGFAVGDVNNDGRKNMVNISYLSTDSVTINVIDLESGELLAQKSLYGFVKESAPVLVDFDQDDELEIMFSVFNDNLGGSIAKGTYVYMLNYSGSDLEMVEGFPLYASYSNHNAHSPSFVDLDNDGKKEIVFDSNKSIIVHDGETLELLDKYSFARKISGPLMFTDINNDGQNEIYAMTEARYGHQSKLMAMEFVDKKLIFFESFGGEHDIITNEIVSLDLPPTPVVADIDDDGEREIVVLSAKKIYIFNKDGSDYEDFPLDLVKNVSGANFTTPSLADFDGDNFLDILFLDSESNVWCYSGASGSVLPGFPVRISDLNRLNYGSLSVADLDDDGDLEFAVGSTSGQIIIYDYPLQSSERNIYSYYRNDLHNSGIFTLSAPQNVTINYQNGHVIINWEKVEGANYYKIISSASPYGPFKEEKSGITKGTSWQITVNKNTRRYYRIIAVR